MFVFNGVKEGYAVSDLLLKFIKLFFTAQIHCAGSVFLCGVKPLSKSLPGRERLKKIAG